jgi:hypothetical protein
MTDKLTNNMVWVQEPLADHPIVKIPWYLDSATSKDLEVHPEVVVARGVVEGKWIVRVADTCGVLQKLRRAPDAHIFWDFLLPFCVEVVRITNKICRSAWIYPHEVEEVICTVAPKPGEREDAGVAENVDNRFHRMAAL